VSHKSMLQSPEGASTNGYAGVNRMAHDQHSQAAATPVASSSAPSPAARGPQQQQHHHHHHHLQTT